MTYSLKNIFWYCPTRLIFFQVKFLVTAVDKKIKKILEIVKVL